MTNVALLGGSFNPPHTCHILCATWVLTARPVDEVWLMPVGQHAFGKNLEPFEHRMAMCEAAIEPIRHHCRVTDIEQRLGGQNRTLDTLSVLDREHPDVNFSLIIGADILLESHLWKGWDTLKNQYGFHILGRDGYPSPPKSQGFQVTLPEISSTDIRARLSAGDLNGCLGQLDLDVMRYIIKHRLYSLPETSNTPDLLKGNDR